MKILIIFTLLVSSALAQDFVPQKKYYHLYNKNLDGKALDKKGYIKSYDHTAHIKPHITPEQEESMLVEAGLKEYIKDKDSLDRKIMIHRLRKYVPKKLITFYPKIPKEILLKAQRRMK